MGTQLWLETTGSIPQVNTEKKKFLIFILPLICLSTVQLKQINWPLGKEN